MPEPMDPSRLHTAANALSSAGWAVRFVELVTWEARAARRAASQAPVDCMMMR